MNKTRNIGETIGVGYEIGVRKTLPLSLEEAWAFVTSPKGLNIWIGEIPQLSLIKGETFETNTGITGEIRVVNPLQNIRITWKPISWVKPSTMQVRVIPVTKDKTTISFHQENLPDEICRIEMQKRWQTIFEKIEQELKKG